MGTSISGTSVAQRPESEQLSDLYQFRGPEVELMLPHEPPEMLALFREAAAQIQVWFGPGTEVVLEFAIDPEDEGNPGQFFAWVQTPLEPEQIRSTMDGFRKHWLIPAWLRSEGRFNVGMEYR